MPTSEYACQYASANHQSFATMLYDEATRQDPKAFRLIMASFPVTAVGS